ncbi:MAG: MFS transporter [Alphaproteobacteria bacterium]
MTLPHRGMGFREFVALIALLMAVNALSIDAMLPALPAIGHALGVATDNERQWVAAYLLGFGVSQLAYGPLSDRYGRKPVLLAGLGLFVVFSIAAAFASSFAMLLTARAMQGVGSAATRVLGLDRARLLCRPARMARVMSLTFIVFLTVPILAPSIGQAILPSCCHGRGSLASSPFSAARSRCGRRCGCPRRCIRKTAARFRSRASWPPSASR